MALGQNTTGSDNIAQGYHALNCNSTANYNIALGGYAGCAITTGSGNVIIGSYGGSAGLSCTVVVQAGNCQRIKVDGGGLCINGALFTIFYKAYW